MAATMVLSTSDEGASSSESLKSPSRRRRTQPSATAHAKDSAIWSQTNWENFCGSTTWHGWCFLYDDSLEGPTMVFARCFWVFIVLLTTALCVVLVYITIQDWKSGPIDTTFTNKMREAGKGAAPFPAVTICSPNLVSRSFAKGYGPGEPSSKSSEAFFEWAYRGVPEEGHSFGPEQIKGVVDWRSVKLNSVIAMIAYMYARDENDALRIAFNLLSAENKNFTFELVDLLPFTADWYRPAATQIFGRSEVFHAYYKGRTLPTDRARLLLHPFFDTDAGYCAYIRPEVMFAEENDDKTYVQMLESDLLPQDAAHLVEHGEDGGLQLVLDAETYDYGEVSSGTAGFQVYLSHALDLPLMKFADIDVAVGNKALIMVEPKVIQTDETVQNSYATTSRECYRKNEFPLNILSLDRYRYSYDNCIAEKMLADTNRKCHCKRGIENLNDSLHSALWHLKTKGGFQNFPLPMPERVPATPTPYYVTEDSLSCQGVKVNCMRSQVINLGSYDYTMGKDKLTRKCRAACDSVIFHSTVSVSRFSNYNAHFYDQEGFCKVFRKISAICRGWPGPPQDKYGNTRFWHSLSFFKAKQLCEHLFKIYRAFGAEQPMTICTNMTQLHERGICTYSKPLIPEEYGQEIFLERIFNDTFRQNLTAELDAVTHEALENGEIYFVDGGYFTCPDCKSETIADMRRIVFHYVRNNMVGINVFLPDEVHPHIFRGEKRPLLWILADIGGLTGLACGCSAVTFVEVAYFIFNYLLYVRRRHLIAMQQRPRLER